MVLLLAAPSCLGYFEDLAKCFQDPAYESFLVTAQNGLHPTPLAKRVVVVGAGMSGLAAAKTLQDAGHQVRELGGGSIVCFQVAFSNGKTCRAVQSLFKQLYVTHWISEIHNH